MAKPSLADLLSGVGEPRRTVRTCVTCSHPAAAEIHAALELMAAGKLSPHFSLTVLHLQFLARAEAIGAPYAYSRSAFDRHIMQCERRLWDAVRQARRRG